MSTRFNKGSVAQGAVVVNADVDFIELEERRTNRLNPSFEQDYHVLHHPVAPAPGQDPGYQHHLLTGELAWMRVDAEPSAQQEPVVFSSFTDAQVHSAELAEYDGVDIPKEEKLWRALRKKYTPVGFVHHDVRVAVGTEEVQDRPNIRCAGITNFEHFGSEPIGFWEPLVADVPRAEERRRSANQSTAGSKACGVLRPLNTDELQPTPEYLARLFGVHSPTPSLSSGTSGGNDGRPRRPVDRDDYASGLLDFMQFCFYLGAQAQKDYATSGATPEQIAGLEPTTGAMRDELRVKDMGDWNKRHVPEMLVRTALGMSPQAVQNIPKLAQLNAKMRTRYMSTGPRFLALHNESVRKISRRIVGFSTRAVNPGYQGEMFIKMGL